MFPHTPKIQMTLRKLSKNPWNSRYNGLTATSVEVVGTSISFTFQSLWLLLDPNLPTICLKLLPRYSNECRHQNGAGPGVTKTEYSAETFKRDPGNGTLVASVSHDTTFVKKISHRCFSTRILVHTNLVLSRAHAFATQCLSLHDIQ